MKVDLRVQSTTRTAHILLYHLCNNPDILNDILPLDLALLDRLQDTLGASFERQTRIAIAGDLVLLRKLGLGGNQGATGSLDGRDEG